MIPQVWNETWMQFSLFPDRKANSGGKYMNLSRIFRGCCFCMGAENDKRADPAQPLCCARIYNPPGEMIETARRMPADETIRGISLMTSGQVKHGSLYRIKLEKNTSEKQRENCKKQP